MSQKKSKGSSASSTFRIGIVFIVLALIAGYILTVRGNQTPAASQGDSNPVVAASDGTESFYREVSIQQIADVIQTAEHSLVYYRSPT